MSRRVILAGVLVLSWSFLSSPTASAEPQDKRKPDPPGSIVPTNWISIPSLDDRGRQPFNPNGLLRHHLMSASQAPPSNGASITGSLGEQQTWMTEKARRAATTEEAGRVRLSAAYVNVKRDEPGAFVVSLQGASTFYVNGAGYAGDGYGFKFAGVPVLLRKGSNHIFVQGIRRNLRMVLSPPTSDVVLGKWDCTVPSAIRGKALKAPGAIPVLNCSDEPLRDVVLTSSGKRFVTTPRATPITIPPYTLLKIPFDLELASPAKTGEETLSLEVSVSVEGVERARIGTVVKVFDADEGHLRTFLSWIDGSTQRYAVKAPENPNNAGLILSLHGAGVRPMNQINAYARKPDFWTIAPTNRRPFGFDWQDWGRLDAYEVLADALSMSGARSDRVCLTGHSMGGHGTWHLGANDPDRWVGIAPCAGWISFDSYGGRPDSAAREPWKGADLASDTLGLLDNLIQLPTYVHHGAADPTVPPSEARRMIKAYAEKGVTAQSHFEPGAKHWWNRKDTKGADCVDWAPINGMFRTSPSPAERAGTSIRFTTVDPVVDQSHYWMRVTQPLLYGTPIRMEGSWDAASGTVKVTTQNARAIEITPPSEQPVRSFSIDGRSFEGSSEPVWFLRSGETWKRSAAAPSAEQKSPERSGPFKRAFDRRFVLVVPAVRTGRNTEAARVAFERARYDSAVWHYRGNGLAPIVSDREFIAERNTRFAGRNVILYGNEINNAAWTFVFAADGPVQVGRESIRVGDQVFKGGDLGCVFVRPRKDDPQALAAAFGSTGAAGARAGYGLMPFISGVGYPDYAVFSSSFLAKGDEGVLAAGWFDHEWKLDGRELRR